MAKVKQLINDNHNPAANQFVIETEDYIFFQSYNSVIARWSKKDGSMTITPKWDYSTTTRKHFYIFVRDYTQYCGNRAATLKYIAEGKFKVVADGQLNY